jgi:hypothetical protein
VSELHREIDRFVGRALQQRHDVVEAHLRGLAPGQTLCVHDGDMPGGDVAACADTHVVILGHLHVLAPGARCESPVRRVQYGPTPADWPGCA